ncbi:Oidioi.mRNA.OKI2018_I69.XSR.g13912.t1.cds [Oikopleura dioica]|uniref:Oidioi.mRNA.OKI2018_I69.XSR.g13912.t1.cds n=1 Tax=Oikopleura dioica TaxID=34765 RepID=A0ABN7SD32_OIKDI|nr:Oidioi.mRNA.OKI2018_I69.XSR.g13912.t1.cds [Oikopleura dioica]
MFQLLWVFFVQLLAQTVEIYPSENFRYIAVVNGTKSYGIIFGAADPDLDTTGFTYLIRDELHPTFNTTMAFLLLGHTENSIGFTDEYRGIVRDADGNVFLNKTAIIAPRDGILWL